MVSLKDAVTVWCQSQKEDFLIPISMKSGHGPNPIFLIIKKIKIGRLEHSLNLHPLPPTCVR